MGLRAAFPLSLPAAPTGVLPWMPPHYRPGSCRLNLRELGPWASHMRWIIWIMASIGTIYVFFFHER